MAPTAPPRPDAAPRWRETVATRLEQWNTARVHAHDPLPPGPIPFDAVSGVAEFVAAHRAIADEWQRFEEAGGVLPRMEDLFGANQGDVGSWWRAGPIVAARRPVRPLADRFPLTMAALDGLPLLRSAMWSVMGPHTHLPPHRGSNAGALRLLLGVSSAGAVLDIAGTAVDLGDGTGVLFDDTNLHASANPTERPRVVLLCDVLRPLGGSSAVVNRSVVAARHHLTPRYRGARAQAAAWHLALNPRDR